jgi:tricorn protease
VPAAGPPASLIGRASGGGSAGALLGSGARPPVPGISSLPFEVSMRAIHITGVLLGALAVVFLLGSPAADAADKPTLGLRYPSLTPDNQHVVFGYRGDIWIASVDGEGVAQRLTIHESQDTLPRVSPDGKSVAFSSQRNGGYDLFVMPITGGEPKRITFHSGPEILCDWSPDGKRLIFLTARDPSSYGLDLYEVDVAGGTPRRVTFDSGRDATYDKEGKRIVYVRGAMGIYQDDYEGSANFDIYVLEEVGGLPRRVAQTSGNDRYPSFSADGEQIFYVAEEEGVANYFARPADGSGEPRKVTNFKHDVRRPDVGWDWKTTVFEMDGKLYMTDLSALKPEAKLIPLVIRSDVRHSGVEIRTITNGAEQVDVSPDGTQLAFSVHGDIWTMPASGGAGRRVTSGAATHEWPRWRPDGKAIAYQSDEGGDSNVYLLDLESGDTSRLTKHKANDFFHAWSPDGTKLVFSSERSGNRDIWLLEIETGQTTQMTTHPAADDDPVFSPDGQWIAFDSGREGAQAIFVIPADGRNGTPRRVSSGSSFIQVPSFSPDGSMIVFEVFNPTGGGSGGLYVVSSQGGPQMQISRDGSAARWSPRGDYIYFTAERGPASEIYRIAAPHAVEMGERVPFMGRVEVDLREELANLFDEAWKALKDNFYDPKMHGVNWDQMKARYREMAIDSENKDEFHNVIRQLLAELGASHLGINGGYRPANMATPDAPETGHLGVDFDPTPVEGGRRRIANVFPDGPADKAGLRVGDVLVGIGRKRLKPNTNLDELLSGTVGEETTVVFRPITADGLGTERRVDVEPVGLRGLNQLRYRQWVRRNSRTVNEATKGRVGYVHLDGMNGQNLQKFRQAVAQWLQQKRVKGMVLDVRFNGGGNIHEQLMEVLRARPYAEIQQRGSPRRVSQPVLYWDRPVVVLVNEHSFSDAEVFPHAFQASGLGKVVGVQTPGGVIGTNNITLSDGSSFRLPRTGFWTLDGENMEGNGVTPDIIVEETAEDRREGRDPQLQRAIEVVQAEIDEREEAARTEEKPEEATTQPTPEQPETPTPETPTPETPTPVPAPVPDRPSAEGSATDPLADVRPGEWVRYRVTFGGSETIMKMSVVEVRDGRVRFEKEVEQGGEFMPPIPDEVEQGPVLEGLGFFGQVSGHQITNGPVGEGTAEILIAQVQWGQTPLQLFFTNAVPALGLLRVEVNKQVILEAIEWGAPEAAKPEAPAPPEETTEAPAPAPAEPKTPEPKTTTESAPAEEAAPEFANPLYDAQVGEWIRMRHVLPDGVAVITTRVIDVTDDEVVLESSVERGEERADGPTLRRPRTEALTFSRGGAGAEWTRETVTIGDRELDCWVVTTVSRRGAEVRRWYCPEIPVTGIVRMERNGQVVRELIEWGTEG